MIDYLKPSLDKILQRGRTKDNMINRYTQVINYCNGIKFNQTYMKADWDNLPYLEKICKELELDN